jgi:serpin B
MWVLVPTGRAAPVDLLAPELVVGQAVHRANITVDEAGTEAAAVTGVGVEIVSAPPPAQITVRADHPFAFVIVHMPTRTPVFTGQVTDPTAHS